MYILKFMIIFIVFLFLSTYISYMRWLLSYLLGIDIKINLAFKTWIQHNICWTTYQFWKHCVCTIYIHICGQILMDAILTVNININLHGICIQDSQVHLYFNSKMFWFLLFYFILLYNNTIKKYHKIFEFILANKMWN